MKVDQKEIVREVSLGVLKELYPDTLPEFGIVFDITYDALNPQVPNRSGPEKLPGEGSLPFDSAVVSQTVISVVCFSSVCLLKAALKDSAKRDLPHILDSMEKKLSGVTHKPLLVKKVRERIEGILQSL